MGRSLMLIVTGLVLVTGMTKIGMNERTALIPEKTIDYFYEQQARNVSIGLVDQAVQALLDNNDWMGEIETDSYSPGKGKLTAYDQATISNFGDSANVGTWNEYKLLLYSEVEYEGYTVATEVLMQRDSFSKYSYYTNTQPSNIWFLTGDTLSGPVHTNGTFRIAGEPVFEGLVTSPTSWIGHSSYTNNPEFNGGSNFSAPVKTIPAAEQLLAIKNAAASGGINFTDIIRVEPKANGTVDVRTWTGSNWSSTVNYDMSGTNGVLSSSKDIYIEGTVSGALTIHSEEDIEIIGDIYYNDDPKTNPNSTDYLGLVSEGSVVVDRNAHSASGSKDLNIYGSIMALNNSFYVENYTSCCNRGTLHVYGGIIQETRGPVGTFSSGSIYSGFAKDYEYDTRLKYNVPPMFPREAVFSILYWKDKLLEKPSS